MRLCSSLAVALALAFVGMASAEDAKAKEKPIMGSFTRSAGDLELKLVFKAGNVLELHVKAGEDGCVMTNKYTLEKDGTYKCEVTEFERKGDFPFTRDKGYKFSFKAEHKEKDKKVVLTDLNGDDIGDEQKQVVEGDYMADSK